MASQRGESPPNEPSGPAPAHVSFVQRLQRYFGAGVDPRIDLQTEAGESVTEPREPSSQGSTRVEDFVRRLSPSLEGGTRYEIKQEVASGGMGTILRVWDGDLRRNLAMKVMHERGSGSTSAPPGSGGVTVDPERLGRFLEEAQITGQLDHPGVVPVHDLGIDSKGRCYFTMRFVRGRELKEVLDLAREAKEGWTRTKVLGVILKVCEAMAYAHSKGVVHRDLKPANVMVGRFGETYVMDWGLARVLGRRDSHDLRLKPRVEDASALSLVRTVRKDETDTNPDSPLVTMDGDVIGTPSYMAPEQARGRLEEVGPRSDVYSLGAILYYMLTGEAPYVKPGERLSPHTVLTRVLDGPPTRVEALAPHEPPELVAICNKAMARDPEERYGSMLEVADDIQAFLENRVVRAYERGSLAEFKKWVVRNRGAAAGLAGMLVLALASGIYFLVDQHGENLRLLRQQEETLAAKEEALANLGRAVVSEREATQNLELANEGRREADRQAARARENELRALRSGYAANILAADYSLKLNDVAEARARLRETEQALRGFEWDYLGLLASPALADLGAFYGVEALAFHPEEERAIVLTGQGHLEIRDLATGEDVPPDNITATEELVDTLLQLFKELAFDLSPDGTRIALAGAGPTLQVFELETGARPPGVESAGLAGHAVRTNAVAFSPSGRLLASGDDEGQVLVRDALNWEVLARFSGHIGQVTALAWSPDSERLASSSRDGSVRVWDVQGGIDRMVLRGHRGPVRGVAWDLDGEALFTAGEDAAVHQWEVDTGRLVRSFLGHGGPVLALDYDPNRGRLVTGSADRTLRLWSVESGRALVLRGHEAPVEEVAFDAGGERVLSGDQNGTVFLWDASQEIERSELALHRAAVTALAFDPSGERLVSASRDHDLLLWDSATGEPLRRLHRHTNQVNSVVFSPDGRTILSGAHDKLVLEWDARTGAWQRSFGPYGDRWVQSALVTPDGARLILATGDKRVRVIDAQTSEVLSELSGFQYAADAIALSPDGTHLATVGKDLLVWDLRGELAEPIYAKKGRNTCVAFSPDGKRLATGSSLGLLQLWDARTGEWILDQKDQSKRMNALVFSPDGKRLVSASGDGEVRVREADSGETLLVLRDGGGAALALAFSPDGKRLAVGTESGRIYLRDTNPTSQRAERRRGALALREAARERVEGLFDELFRREEVLRALSEDASLSQSLREAALRQVHLRGDDPVPLLVRSLEECIDLEHEPAVYDRALARAAAAEELKAEASPLLGKELEAYLDLVLGAAHYRTGLFNEALLHLARDVLAADTGPRAPSVLFGPREQAVRLLFLCMAQCKTTDMKAAERTWRQAQQAVMDDGDLSQRSDLLGLLAEAETLVRSGAGS
ncbi:MAG TPA: protein kinase [Planctomycetota bacterium]